MGVHDLAAWVTWFARDLDLSLPLDVIGCSLGGWVAAEIATVAPQFFNRMILVGAMGIKPERGETFDYFLKSGPTGFRRAFCQPMKSLEFTRYWGKDLTPEETDLIEQHREMTCRIARKPYMHSLTLRHLLPGVRTPTLLVWGREDAITPLDSGEIYQRVIPGRAWPSSNIAATCRKWRSRPNLWARFGISCGPKASHSCLQSLATAPTRKSPKRRGTGASIRGTVAARHRHCDTKRVMMFSGFDASCERVSLSCVPKKRPQPRNRTLSA